MNILMVGHSGAGKTSFMAGLYRYVGEVTKGYGISAKNESQKVQLEKMANSLSHGEYPQGTDIQQRYEFAFTADGNELIPFQWIDYRGGILLSEDPDDSDMDKFMHAISSADALVVFLDGVKLSQPGSKWNMEYDILISCIESSLTVSHTSIFPISFVITKCDLVPVGTKLYGLSRFYSLFSQIRKSANVDGILVQCKINPDIYYIPFYVLAFCIYRGTPIYKKRCMDAYQAAISRANYHRPRSIIGKVFGVTEAVLSLLATFVDLDWETQYEKTWAAENDAQTQKRIFEQLEICSDELEKKLKLWEENHRVTRLYQIK